MINVLPLQEKNNLKKEYRVRLLSVVLLFVFLLGVISTFLLMPAYIASTAKVDFLEQKLESFNVLHPEISTDDLSKIVGDINETLNLLKNGTPPRNVSNDVLLQILKLRPENILLNQILYSEKPDKSGSVIIYGIAKDREALYSFKSVLESNTSIESVDLPISSFVKRTNINFNLTVKTK